MPGLAQHPLDHRGGVLALSRTGSRRPVWVSGQRLEPPRMLDDLLARHCLIGDRPAEDVRAGVVCDLTTSRRSPARSCRVQKDPALGPQRCLIDFEAVQPARLPAQ